MQERSQKYLEISIFDEHVAILMKKLNENRLSRFDKDLGLHRHEDLRRRVDHHFLEELYHTGKTSGKITEDAVKDRFHVSLF